MVANIEVGNERLNEAEFSTLIAPIIIRSIRREAEREGRTFKSQEFDEMATGIRIPIPDDAIKDVCSRNGWVSTVIGRVRSSSRRDFANQARA